MTTDWSDVLAWQTLWAPDSGAVITANLLSHIQDAKDNGATLFTSNYGFTDANIASLMATFGQANPANRYLFDASEYFGSKEKPIVDALISVLQPEQWAIGTSSVGHNILHSKIAAALYPNGTGWTFSGSFNLSESAEKEFNVADFIWSRSRAEAFAAQIQAKLSWCRGNQPQPPTDRTAYGLAPEGVVEASESEAP